jgi:hypothetical protein
MELCVATYFIQRIQLEIVFGYFLVLTHHIYLYNKQILVGWLAGWPVVWLVG